MGALRGFIVAQAILLGVVTVVAGLTAPDEPSTAPAQSSVSSYSHDLLQRDADMTRQMSAPNADGPMQRYQVVDPQLEHSQQAGFVPALEDHQSDIDRMLATPSR